VVTLIAVVVQVGDPGDTETNVVVDGMLSLTITFWATAGPALETTKV